MKEPLTNELLEELLSSPDPAKFASKNKITHRNLPDYLQQLLDEKGLSRPKVIAEAIVNHFDTEGSLIDSVSIAGPGFINFKLKIFQEIFIIL